MRKESGKKFEQEVTEETENEQLIIPLFSLFPPVQILFCFSLPKRFA
jgi:hypothetical protein